MDAPRIISNKINSVHSKCTMNYDITENTYMQGQAYILKDESTSCPSSKLSKNVITQLGTSSLSTSEIKYCVNIYDNRTVDGSGMEVTIDNNTPVMVQWIETNESTDDYTEIDNLGGSVIEQLKVKEVLHKKTESGKLAIETGSDTSLYKYNVAKHAIDDEMNHALDKKIDANNVIGETINDINDNEEVVLEPVIPNNTNIDVFAYEKTLNTEMELVCNTTKDLDNGNNHCVSATEQNECQNEWKTNEPDSFEYRYTLDQIDDFEQDATHNNEIIKYDIVNGIQPDEELSFRPTNDRNQQPNSSIPSEETISKSIYSPDVPYLPSQNWHNKSLMYNSAKYYLDKHYLDNFHARAHNYVGRPPPNPYNNSQYFLENETVTNTRTRYLSGGYMETRRSINNHRMPFFVPRPLRNHSLSYSRNYPPNCIIPVHSDCDRMRRHTSTVLEPLKDLQNLAATLPFKPINDCANRTYGQVNSKYFYSNRDTYVDHRKNRLHCENFHYTNIDSCRPSLAIRKSNTETQNMNLQRVPAKHLPDAPVEITRYEANINNINFVHDIPLSVIGETMKEKRRPSEDEFSLNSQSENLVNKEFGPVILSPYNNGIDTTEVENNNQPNFNMTSSSHCLNENMNGRSEVLSRSLEQTHFSRENILNNARNEPVSETKRKIKTMLDNKRKGIGNKDKRQQLLCYHCDKRFINEVALEKHVTRNHSLIKTSPQSNGNKHPYRSAQSSKCDKTCKSATELESHIEGKHNENKNKLKTDSNSNKNTSCPECNKSFKSSFGLACHFGQMHRRKGNSSLKRETAKQKLKIYKCQKCSTRFKTSTDLDTHVVQYHSESSSSDLQCKTLFNYTKCNASFPNAATLDNHMTSTIHNLLCHHDPGVCAKGDKNMQSNKNTEEAMVEADNEKDYSANYMEEVKNDDNKGIRGSNIAHGEKPAVKTFKSHAEKKNDVRQTVTDQFNIDMQHTIEKCITYHDSCVIKQSASEIRRTTNYTDGKINSNDFTNTDSAVLSTAVNNTSVVIDDNTNCETASNADNEATKTGGESGDETDPYMEDDGGNDTDVVTTYKKGKGNGNIVKCYSVDNGKSASKTKQLRFKKHDPASVNVSNTMITKDLQIPTKNIEQSEAHVNYEDDLNVTVSGCTERQMMQQYYN